ncbi:MAG: L-rhamnose mutarotase [Candidatus Poribacteria bacterium]|nr:L-rhamnose mutarotase [Candidatus Poribacteria bacterium]
MPRFGLTLNLKDDPDVIEQYKTYHRNVWPEVLDSLREVGITQMDIYLLGNRLFMAIDTVDDFDPVHDFPRHLEIHPRCREWDVLMRNFQERVPEAEPGEWWATMEQVFEL